MNTCLRAISYFRDDLGKIVASLLMIGAMVVLGLLAPVPLAMLVSSVSGGDLEGNFIYRLFAFVPETPGVRQVIVLTLLTAGIKIGAELLRTFQTQLNIAIGYHGRARVQAELFQKLQALSLTYHKSQPQGDAIYRLSYDTHGFQGVLNVVIGAIVHGATLVVMLAIMLVLNWRLTLIALVVVPLLILTIRGYGRILKKHNLEQKQADSALTTQIQRSISTVELVQAFNREQDEAARFLAGVRRYVGASLRLHWQEVLYWLVLGMILSLGTVALFGYGGYQVVRGEMDIGVLLIFLGYLGQLYDPLNKLSGSNAGLQAAMAGVQRVFEVLDRDPVIRDAPDAMRLTVQPRTVRFDRVSFAYRPGEPVLRDITAEIPPGQMVAFVGSSGVGKTTLLNLLPRFYDPTSGVLRLDEIDIRRVKIQDLRRHVALVLQEAVVLPTTIAENIAYGRPDASDAELRRAAEMAGALPFIEKLPEGFNTVISEGGADLSGGQRQRIAIARALLSGAPILVLDEPTSALDSHHEQLVMQTLASLKGQRTIILVSHRISTVAACDQIFVMDDGRIVESGTHSELMAAGGLYWRMAQHQLRLSSDVPVA